ncbi:glycosyltransferase family 2 protein [Furfurilactobacillus curtus]|uniref:Glycosyl transferase n=1 Tax=Furfurilactobacillus curtus TaxID=1746200 RepID=A0ABQ5JNK8_9LACO
MAEQVLELSEKRTPKLVIVVPCYNEEPVLSKTFQVLETILNDLMVNRMVNDTSRLLFVDDGSKDATWPMIDAEHHQQPLVTGVKLSRNFGHQGALLAGLTTASQDADLMVTIDADLQDDPHAIIEMVSKSENADIVYGVRSSRTTDTWFKRWSAGQFYQVMHALGVEMIPNSADFRLMSKRAVQALLSMPERNVFLRGMVPLVGFPSAEVEYARQPRQAGTSKYPLRKMLSFAFDGITSFSTVPIRLIMNLGIMIVIIGIGLLVYSLIQQMMGHVVAGWSSLMISIWVIGGIQLICLSTIGEYIGKIFSEVKRRPRFIIETDTYH